MSRKMGRIDQDLVRLGHQGKEKMKDKTTMASISDFCTYNYDYR